MPRFRGLNFAKFIESVPPDLVSRYFERIPESDRPPPWAALNPDQLLAYLDDPGNATQAAQIGETFQRISDLVGNATSVLYRACERYGIAIAPADDEPLALAFRVYLDFPEAFDFAWARYLLYGTGTKVNTYPFPHDVQPDISEPCLQSFRAALQAWLSARAKGEDCVVRCFPDQDDLIFLIQRGNYVQTVTLWEGGALRTQSFRPAVEDVLVFESDTRLLRVRASYPTERENYLCLFAAHILGDMALADEAKRTELFSLEPIRTDSFSYGGSGQIVGVDLVKARLKLLGPYETVIDIRSADVLRSFQTDLQGLSLRSGVLLMARLRFRIKLPEEPERTLTFEIEPPGRTDLVERRHSELVLRYLEAQGVKLR